MSYNSEELQLIKDYYSKQYQMPPYFAPIEISVDAGQTQQAQFSVPAGSEFMVDGLNFEFTPEANTTCELYVRLRSVSSQTVYTNGFIRVSLIATPGRNSTGTRFGMLPFSAMIPAEDGLIVEVRNNGAATRQLSVCAIGKRAIKLSQSDKNNIINMIMG